MARVVIIVQNISTGWMLVVSRPGQSVAGGGSWQDIIHADYDCRCYYDGVAEEHQFAPERPGLARAWPW